MTSGSVLWLVADDKMCWAPLAFLMILPFTSKWNVKALKTLSKGKVDIVTRIMQPTEGDSGKSLIRLLMREGFQSPEVERTVVWIGMLKMKMVGIIPSEHVFKMRLELLLKILFGVWKKTGTKHVSKDSWLGWLQVCRCLKLHIKYWSHQEYWPKYCGSKSQ